jgi:hypothetical protein
MMSLQSSTCNEEILKEFKMSTIDAQSNQLWHSRSPDVISFVHYNYKIYVKTAKCSYAILSESAK